MTRPPAVAAGRSADAGLARDADVGRVAEPPSRLGHRTVDAGGLRWWVTRHGPATPSRGGGPLLLLHGTGASAHSWQGLTPLLAAGREVLAVDLPGHGRSGPLPARRQSLPGMAAALADLLQALALQPSAVIGHSAGAALMLRLALDGHLPGARLIGLNAALQPLEGLAGWLFPPLARLLARQPLVPRLAAWRAQDERAVRRLIASTGSALDDDGVASYAGLLRDPRHVAGVLAMTAHWDLGPLLQDLRQDRLRTAAADAAPAPAGRPQVAPGSLTAPLHLLVGEADRTVPPRQAEQLAAQWPGVQVHRLPGLGHLAHEEAPQAVAARLLPLLDAADSGSA